MSLTTLGGLRRPGSIAEVVASPNQGLYRMCNCKLLCFGRDAQLVESRVRILSLHYSAAGVNSVGNLRTLRDQEFDVVLLCHSLASEDRRAAILFIRERWPNAKLLQIVNVRRGQELCGADAEVGALDGPRALLRSVEELLSAQPGHVFRGCEPKPAQMPTHTATRNGSGRASQLSWTLPGADRISYCHDLLGASQRCMQLARGSMVSMRETLANSMARITTSKELIARCDDRLQSYGGLRPIRELPPLPKRTGEHG